MIKIRLLKALAFFSFVTLYITPAFAEDLISQLGGEITYRSEVVTGHWWEFNLKGHKLRLIYDEFPINGVWLEQQASGSNEFMVSLYDEFVTSKRGQ